MNKNSYCNWSHSEQRGCPGSTLCKLPLKSLRRHPTIRTGNFRAAAVLQQRWLQWMHVMKFWSRNKVKPPLKKKIHPTPKEHPPAHQQLFSEHLIRTIYCKWTYSLPVSVEVSPFFFHTFIFEGLNSKQNLFWEIQATGSECQEQWAGQAVPVHRWLHLGWKRRSESLALHVCRKHSES